jgi:hypothetical protein
MVGAPSASRVDELRGGEIAEFVEKRLQADAVQLFAVREPVVAALLERVRFSARVHFDLARIIEAEVEQLLTAQVIQGLVNAGA